MINTKELEKRWLKYKTKSYLLLLFIITIVVLLIYGGYYILYKLDLNIDREKNIKPTADVKMVKDKNVTVTSLASFPTPIKKDIEVKSDDNIVSLSPIIPIVDIDSETAKSKTVKKVTPKRKRVKKRLVKAKKSNYLTPDELKEIENKVTNLKDKKKKINFKTSSSNYIEIMKEKFHKNRNPREAILIAKAYYRAGDYKKSEEWALKANNLNNNLEESWLLFAKSKNALGKQEEALKILIAYYNKTKSPKVKLLIEKISSKSI